jgi:parallel beta-helix repeat protein
MTHDLIWYKKIFHCLLALTLIISVLSGCQPIEIGEPGAMTGSATPVKKSGELTRDEAWSGIIIVESSVTVPKGKTLTITNGTTVKFAQEAGLLVDGSLYAEGQVNSAITISSNAQEPKPGDWNGIVFSEFCLNSRMEYCVVDFHKRIFSRSDSLRITNSIIAEASEAGFVCDSVAPVVEDNMITKNEVGIRCEGSASPNINHNAITANIGDGIECNDSSFPKIHYNTISNNRKNGISCHSVSSPEVESNNIMYNGGWAVYGGGRLIGNFIQGNREQGMNAIDASESLSSNQYYGVERVDSPRSSRIQNAGVRREERW